MPAAEIIDALLRRLDLQGLVEVRPGREIVLAAGNDDAAHLGIIVERLHCGDELVHQRDADGIAALRPIERDDAGGAALLDQYRLVWIHGRLS